MSSSSKSDEYDYNGKRNAAKAHFIARVRKANPDATDAAIEDYVEDNLIHSNSWMNQMVDEMKIGHSNAKMFLDWKRVWACWYNAKECNETMIYLIEAIQSSTGKAITLKNSKDYEIGDDDYYPTKDGETFGFGTGFQERHNIWICSIGNV